MSRTAALPPIAALLPHTGPAILLDRVLRTMPDGLVAGVRIDSNSPYAQSAGVPAHVAIEYMAQACAAWVGLDGHDHGTVPRIGLLLGTRDFRATRPWFKPGESLEVAVTVNFLDGNVGVFDARVQCAGATLCTAQLTVYQPDADDPRAPGGREGRGDDG